MCHIYVALCLWSRVCVCVYSLFVCMESSIGKTLALKLSEEHAVAESDVIDFVPGAAAVHSLPLLGGLLTFPTDVINMSLHLHVY